MNPTAHALVRAWIRELRADGRSQAEVGAIFGLSQPRISRIESGKDGASSEALTAAARKLGRLDAAFQALNAGNKSSTTQYTEREDRYPNRASAIKAATELEYDGRAIEAVRDYALDSDEDPPKRWWLEKIASIEREINDPFRPKGPSGRKETEDL